MENVDFNTLMQQLSDAAVAHNWVVMVAVILLLVVPVVLKALGKKIPLLDSILSWAASMIPALKAKTDKPAPEVKGVEAVVKVEDEGTK